MTPYQNECKLNRSLQDMEKKRKKQTVVRFGNIMACFTQNAHHLDIYRLFKQGTKHLMA